MGFREMVEEDNLAVFSNLEEFADPHTIIYDDERYEDVPCTITKLKAQDRATTQVDHMQGIYFVTSIVHFPLCKLNGIVPEKGRRIAISDETGFMRESYVAQSGCDMGMVRLELEAYDE